MKICQLTGIREMSLTQTAKPAVVEPDDVLLRVQRVGVCGSDVHYYTSGKIGSQLVEYPFAVGHEMSGTVEQVGSAVHNLAPGNRAAIDPAVSCWPCDQCLAGRPHTCRKLVFLGCPGQLEGCLGEYLVMPEECCYVIPDAMSMDLAALVEPLSIGVYAVQQSIPMCGAKVGILGMGPIGFSVMLPALAAGAAEIYATDRIDDRLELAAVHGATWTGNPDKIDVVEEITGRESQLLDVVFECCGEQEALDQALRLLKPGGKLMLIGIPAFERYSFAAEIARRREICMQHVRRQNGCVQKTIELMASGEVDPAFMITHHYVLEDAKAAFDLVDRYADGVLKAMIRLA